MVRLARARFMYSFFSTAVTYPLMFAISVCRRRGGDKDRARSDRCAIDFVAARTRAAIV